jgi:hypothetical protein
VPANRIIFLVLGGRPEVRVGLDVVSFDPRHHQKLQHSCFHVLLFFYPPTTGEILMQYLSNIFIVVESQCVSFLMFFFYELQIQVSSIYLSCHVSSYHQLEGSTYESVEHTEL